MAALHTFFTVLLIAGIAATMVLLCLKVLPKKLDGTFSSKLLQFLHDYFNFKNLYIEVVLKFIFTLATVACILAGVVGILEAICGFFAGLVDAMDYGSRYFGYVTEAFFMSLLGSIVLMVVGPVVLRLTYEFSMMFIMLVKNVMEINNKTKGDPAQAPVAPQTPVAPQAPQYNFNQAPQAPQAPQASQFNFNQNQ